MSFISPFYFILLYPPYVSCLYASDKLESLKKFKSCLRALKSYDK